jgi:ATP/maltotriose-dependent transcriptional regulator MalT
MGNLIDAYAALGRWDDVADVEDTIPDDLDPAATANLSPTLAFVARHRGDRAMAERALDRAAPLESSATVQDRRSYWMTKWNVLMVAGKETEALEWTHELAESETVPFHEVAWGIIDPAIRLGRFDVAAETLDRLESMPPGEIDVVYRAVIQAGRACVAAGEGDTQKAEDSFLRSTAAFREYGLPFFLAHALVWYCEWLVAQGRVTDAEHQAAEAREILERLGARPWLERLERLPIGVAVVG